MTGCAGAPRDSATRPNLLDSARVAGRVRALVRNTSAQAAYSPGFALLWVDVTGRPGNAAREAIELLGAAPADGLDSTAYDAGRLERRRVALAGGRRPALEEVTAFDVDLTSSVLRLLNDLHEGRVDPSRFGFDFARRKDRHDLPAQLRKAAADGELSDLAEKVRPQAAQYERLREALAKYRELAREAPAWNALPKPGPPVKPGDPYPGLATVAERLALLGDLSGSARDDVDSARYREPLVDAVKRFQARHGLEADGVLTPPTIAALDVPPSRRAGQLALSLERLRWMPELDSGRYVVVNIPTYHLWAWDTDEGGTGPALSMRVIVGKGALNTRTPVFVEEMRYVVFRPYWDVPPGITRNEILPAARKNPHYLASQDMEIVPANGRDDPPDDVEEGLELVEEGRARIRQRPGPRNALGLVKFIFPNDESVYLHGTPAEELFARNRRAYSHGCVRVEDPVELAEWVLRDVPGWDRERILDAMHGRSSKRVNLATPVRVVLFYTTATVERDGTVEFYEDLYGHDDRLLAAMDGAGR